MHSGENRVGRRICGSVPRLPGGAEEAPAAAAGGGGGGQYSAPVQFRMHIRSHARLHRRRRRSRRSTSAPDACSGPNQRSARRNQPRWEANQQAATRRLASLLPRASVAAAAASSPCSPRNRRKSLERRLLPRRQAVIAAASATAVAAAAAAAAAAAVAAVLSRKRSRRPLPCQLVARLAQTPIPIRCNATLWGSACRRLTGRARSITPPSTRCFPAGATHAGPVTRLATFLCV